MMKKVLFIFHEATYTGATINLLRTIRWLSENIVISMSFLFINSGNENIISDVKKIGKIYLWNPQYVDNSFIAKILNRTLRKFINSKKILNALKKENIDVLYANTVLSSDLIVALSHLKCKKIWHIHELMHSIDLLGINRLGASQYVDIIIANSNITRNNLIELGVDKAKIQVIYPVINVNEIASSASDLEVRKYYNIPNSAFVIGSSGIGIDLKGINTFLHLPELIDYFYPSNNFYYIWVGKIGDPKTKKLDVKKMQMDSKLIFTGELSNPYPIYRIFDIFVSCSKEESFGLSAIEAAALHKPIICFDKTGGLEEIVKNAHNILVPYFKIIEMAKEAIMLSENIEKRKELGIKSYNYALNFDVEILMPKLLDIMFA